MAACIMQRNAVEKMLGESKDEPLQLHFSKLNQNGHSEGGELQMLVEHAA